MTDGEFWERKIRAFCVRLPGQASALGDDLTLRADCAAFATDRSAVAPDIAVPVAIHPLSGETLRLDGLESLPWEAVRTAVSGYIASLSLRYTDPKTRFLALWRLLPDPETVSSLALDQTTKTVLHRFWRVLPADPQYSQSLWEHQSLVSALIGTAKDGRLDPVILQFNIADTQPFIVRSRRTQDLWAGSYLISFLCWRMLRSFAERFGPDAVLSPALRGQPLTDLWLREQRGVNEVEPPDESSLLIATIPNIFTILLPGGCVEEAVQAAIQEARDGWREISEAVRRQTAQAAGDSWQGCDDLWERQTEAFFRDNLFWAALPFPAEPMDAATLERWLSDREPFLRRSSETVSALRTWATEEPASGILYGLCSQLTAQALSDRKRLRDFGQVEEPGQKCSLSGVLQAVTPTTDEKGGDALARTRDWWEKLATVRRPACKMAGRIRRGDQLSSVFLTRRLMLQAYFGEKHIGVPCIDRHQYPSTAGIANARFTEGALRAARTDPAARTLLRNYRYRLRRLLGRFFYPSASLPAWKSLTDGDRDLRRFTEIDGECLYEEFYDPDRLQQTFGVTFNAADITQAKVAREALVRFLSPRLGAPTRYYAILMMDGDRMGEWISGRMPGTFPSRPPLLGPGLHQGFTAALSHFALEDVRRIVERDHAGKLVYAGGDDVLALLPVSDLLSAMDALYIAFRGEEITPGMFRGFVPSATGAMGLRMGSATLSAGAVIVHEAVPLTNALEQAREAEREAKQNPRYGRDAFVIRLLKRAGAPGETGAHWREGNQNVLRLVREAARLMRSIDSAPAGISPALAYSLNEIPLESIALAWGDSGEKLSAARRAQFLRLAQRRTDPALWKNPTSAYQEVIEGFRRLIARPGNGSWEQVTGLLRLARELAEGVAE